MWAYCQEQGIAFSRSRAFHENDNPHVEQTNWMLVRRLVGYQRLEAPEQLAWLEAFYTELLRPLLPACLDAAGSARTGNVQ